MKLAVLGTRGIPAAHGGFETFCQHLAIHLCERGWEVTVYCQEDGSGPIHESKWKGIRRVHIPTRVPGALGTMWFDLRAVLHSLSEPTLALTLGYNTAIFNVVHRLFSKPGVINMDGIEWRRSKWGRLAKAWFWLNERVGSWVGDHLVADHPEIKKHLERCTKGSKISMIPYGAAEILAADDSLLSGFGVEPGKYSLIVCRPEPENSVHEMVSAFSRSRRNHKLIVLGNFDPVSNAYHREVIESAGDEVIFPGAIYESGKLAALRYHCRLYFHGHQVGGTNPSLVEAMGAGNAVLAHDNPFNRWVAGAGGVYFSNTDECAALIDHLLADTPCVEFLKSQSHRRFLERFTWGDVLADYEAMLTRFAPCPVLVHQEPSGS